MSKNLSSLLFLIAIVVFGGVVILLLQAPAPFRTLSPGAASAQPSAELSEELQKTTDALKNLGRLALNPGDANFRDAPLANLLPLAADAPPAIAQAQMNSLARGYSVPFDAQSSAARPQPPPYSAVRPPANAARPPPGVVRPPAGAVQPSYNAALDALSAVAGTPSPLEPPAQAAQAEPEPFSDVSMIFIAPDMKQAIIDGVIVHEKDRLANGSRVVSIREKSVIVRKDGKRYTFKVPEQFAPALPEK